MLLVLYIRNRRAVQGHKDLLVCFLASFTVLALIFRYMIHLGLKFVYGVKRGDPLARGYPAVLGLFVEEITLIECFGTLVKKQSIINIVSLFLDSQLYFICPQSMFIFMPVSHSLSYCSSEVKF